MAAHDNIVFIALLSGVAVSVAVAMNLISTRNVTARTLQSFRTAANEIPIAGSISGTNLRGGKDWKPHSGDNAGQLLSHVVVFPVSAKDFHEATSFWREVAEIVQSKTNRAMFVGVCRPEAACRQYGDQNFGPMTILIEMDPTEMRAVEVAKSRNLALVYLGQELRDAVSIDEHPQRVALSVIELVNESSD